MRAIGFSLTVISWAAVVGYLAFFASCQSKPARPVQSVEDTVVAILPDTVHREMTVPDTIVPVKVDTEPAVPDSTDMPDFKREGNYIYLSKPKMRLYIVNANDSVLFSCGMACGIKRGDKREIGDYRTPEGRYRICGIYESSDWIHKTRDGRKVKGCYGPYFFSLSTGEFQGIGIHGTNAPSSIGKRASEGCVRLLTKNIIAIYEHYAFLGMRVVISGERERLPRFNGLGKEYRSAEDLRASLTPQQILEDSLRQDSLPTNNIAEPDAQIDSCTALSDSVRAASPDTLPVSSDSTSVVSSDTSAVRE